MNLDFSGKNQFNFDLPAGQNSQFNYYFNNKIFHWANQARLPYFRAAQYSELGNPDADNNYFKLGNTYSIYDANQLKSSTPIGVKKFSSSNNHLYLFTTYHQVYDLDLKDNKKAYNITENKLTNDVLVFLNVQQKNNDNILYAGLDSDRPSLNQANNSDLDDGLWKSINNGETYNLLKNTDNLKINEIKRDVISGDIFLSTEDNGVWYSTGNDDNFKQLPGTENKNINSKWMFLYNNQLFFSYLTGGLYKYDILDKKLSQITTPNYIQSNTKIKSMVSYYDGTLILLTDKHIIYLYEG